MSDRILTDEEVKREFLRLKDTVREVDGVKFEDRKVAAGEVLKKPESIHAEWTLYPDQPPKIKR